MVKKGVYIFGERVPVRATIRRMAGFSAHAGQKDLLKWFDAVALSKPRTIITHGEDRAREIFSGLIRSKHVIKTQLPQLGDVIEI